MTRSGHLFSAAPPQANFSTKTDYRGGNLLLGDLVPYLGQLNQITKIEPRMVNAIALGPYFGQRCSSISFPALASLLGLKVIAIRPNGPVSKVIANPLKK